MVDAPSDPARTAQPSDKFIAAFASASSAGCVLELKYRLLADMRPTLRPVARAQKLGDVESAIVNEYRPHLSEREVKLLNDVRVLRNKVLHCDFDVAHEKLRDMGVHLLDGLVTQVNVSTGDATPVTADVEWKPVFGWLLQSAMSGMFKQAELRFYDVIAVIDRLLALG